MLLCQPTAIILERFWCDNEMRVGRDADIRVHKIRLIDSDLIGLVNYSVLSKEKRRKEIDVATEISTYSR